MPPLESARKVKMGRLFYLAFSLLHCVDEIAHSLNDGGNDCIRQLYASSLCEAVVGLVEKLTEFCGFCGSLCGLTVPLAIRCKLAVTHSILATEVGGFNGVLLMAHCLLGDHIRGFYCVLESLERNALKLCTVLTLASDERILQNQKARRQKAERKVKRLCIDYLGGKCQFSPKCCSPILEDVDFCEASFQFHHRKRATKKFKITAAIKALKKEIFEIQTEDDLRKLCPHLIAELDKCDLLCANCHHRLEYCCLRKKLAPD